MSAGTRKVYLVGAGPGTADLLTVRALRLIEAADWLVVDALVADDIIALARRARCIAVGKRAGRDSTPQVEINKILIDCANKGGLVVRLKGGDPLLFARASEELDALADAGIAVEVVPGISAAQAAFAALAEPMTERGQRRAVVFATPRVQPEDTAGTAWARPIVSAEGGAVYMAAAVISRVRATLLSLGMRADTPATWVINVARPDQTIVHASLGDLAPIPASQAGQPAVLILGGRFRSQAVQLATQAGSILAPR